MGFWTIFKKETRIFLTTPATHVVLTIFLLLSGFFFYTNLQHFIAMSMGGRGSIVKGLWLYFFNDLRFILTFVLPLITMRVFAEEKKLGTIELITTYPVRDASIIAGKYLACILMYLTMLALTFLYVLLLGAIWGFFEIAPILAGYLGLFLLGGAMISCGLFVSSTTENQVVAAMGTVGFFIVFWFLNWNEMIGSHELVEVLRRISLFDAAYGFFQGIIRTRDVVYFLLVGGFFLFLTHLSLGSRAWKGMK